ncbi:hypothetical protein FOL47_002677, partial [Perkinsus chesapeaki]
KYSTIQTDRKAILFKARYVFRVLASGCTQKPYLLPFGLVGAPASFMRMVSSVFADMLCETDSQGDISLAAYMDDLLIDYVGYRVSKDGVSPDPTKAREIASITTPTSYASRTCHLRRLTHDNVPWRWSEREQREFEDIKGSLSNSVLIHPNFSAALCQVDSNGIERPVKFASRALTSAESHADDHRLRQSSGPGETRSHCAALCNHTGCKRRRTTACDQNASSLSSTSLYSKVHVAVSTEEVPPLRLPSRQEVIAAQRRDPSLSQVIQDLPRVGDDNFYKLDPLDGALLMVAPYPDSWDIPQDVEKLVIPDEYHLSQPDSAHQGREATLSSVGRSFWWCNMAKSVKKFCKLRTSIYTKPFSAIGVDLIEMPPGESDSE